MSYQTIFNGKNLDELVPGYMTLNIEGRGLLGRRINNIEITGRDGTLSQSSTLPDRTITVHFYLNCDNAKQREESTRMLHELLHSRGNKKIEFTDLDSYLHQITCLTMSIKAKEVFHSYAMILIGIKKLLELH